MTDVKVVHSTDIGSTLSITSGKLEAADSLATDMEVSASVATATATAAADATAKAEAARVAAISASQTDATAQVAAAMAAENAEDAATAAANASAAVQAARRSNYISNAKSHLQWSAVFVVDESIRGVRWGASGGYNYGRAIIMGGGQGDAQGASGYYDINPPVVGETVYGLGIGDTFVDTNGFILLPNWGSLYYKLPPANTGAGARGTFHAAGYEYSNYDVTEDMVYLGTFNHDRGLMFHRNDGVVCGHGLTFPDTPWIDMTPYFASGIVNYGMGYQTCRFRRQGNRVYCEGLALDTTGTVGVAMDGLMNLATLPEGFRPNMRHIFTSNSHALQRRIDVTQDGGIDQVVNGDVHPWIPLEFSYSLN